MIGPREIIGSNYFSFFFNLYLNVIANILRGSELEPQTETEGLNNAEISFLKIPVGKLGLG